MAANQDFEDLLQCLNAAKVEYLIVGAHAVSLYTEPRYTKDIDIWVNPTTKNAEKVYAALKAFRAPISSLKVNDLANPELVYQIGVVPVRIDIMMGISGVDFPTAWKHKKSTKFGNQKVFVIGLSELIINKKATARPQDKLDIKKLTQSTPTKKRQR